MYLLTGLYMYETVLWMRGYCIFRGLYIEGCFFEGCVWKGVVFCRLCLEGCCYGMMLAMGGCRICEGVIYILVIDC